MGNKNINQVENKKNKEAAMGELQESFKEGIGLAEVEQALFSFDEAKKNILLENEEVKLNCQTTETRTVCENAEIEIKEASNKNELKILKLVSEIANNIRKNLADREKRWKLESLEKDILNTEIPGFWNDRSLVSKKGLIKADKRYDIAKNKIPSWQQSILELDKDFFDQHTLENINYKIKNSYDRLVDYAISKGDLNEAISLWHDCPRTNRGDFDDYDFGNRNIREAILNESGENFYDNKDGYIKKAEYLKDKLADYPDLYLSCICAGNDWGARKTLSEKGYVKDALLRVLKDEKMASAANFVNLRDDLLLRDRTPEIVSGCFKELAKIGSFQIENNASIFQNEIENLPRSEKVDLLRRIAGFSEHSLEKIMTFVKISKDELAEICNSDEIFEELMALVNRDNFSNPKLAALTNVEMFNLGKETQEEILSKILKGDNLSYIIQICSHPEKYPAFDKNNILDVVVNASLFNDSLKWVFFNLNLSSHDALSVVNRFYKENNSEYILNDILRLINVCGESMDSETISGLEKICIHHAAGSGLHELELLKNLSHSTIEKIIDAVQIVNFDNVLEKENAISFFGPYRKKLIPKFEHLDDAVEFIREAKDLMKITEEEYSELISEMIDLMPIYKIAISKFIELLDHNLLNKIVNVAMEENNFDALYSLSFREYLNIDTEKRQMMIKKAIAIADKNQTELLYYNREIRHIYGLNAEDNLINIFLDNGNVKFISFFNIDRINNELSDDMKEKLLNLVLSSKETVISSGDLESVNILMTYIENGYCTINDNEREKIISLVISGDSIDAKKELLNDYSSQFKLKKSEVKELLSQFSNIDTGLLSNFIQRYQIMEANGNGVLDKDEIDEIIDNCLKDNLGIDLLNAHACLAGQKGKNGEQIRMLSENQISQIIDKVNSCNLPDMLLDFFSSLYDCKQNGALPDFSPADRSKYFDIVFTCFEDGRIPDKDVNLIFDLDQEAFIAGLDKLLRSSRPINTSLIQSIIRKENIFFACDNILSNYFIDNVDNFFENSNQKFVEYFYENLIIFGRVDGKYMDALEKIMDKFYKNRDRMLFFTGVYSFFASENCKAKESFFGKEMGQEVESFIKDYPIGNKGKTISTLVAANEYKLALENGRDLSFKSILKSISEKLSSYREVISSFEKDIPVGLKTSLGLEYEATEQIASGYNEKTNNKFKADISKISELADIGQGSDAVHEFATRPTDNPALLLLEIKLLSELDFIDFNFKPHEQGGYKGAASGYHLTLGGQRGLESSSQVHFLQNMIIAAGWGGVCSGTEVSRTERGRGSSLRARGIGSRNVKVFENHSSSVELRCLSVDKVEQFERAIISAYYGAIATQAAEEYLNFKENVFEEEFLEKMPLDNTDNLFSYLSESGYLKENKEEMDDRTKEIIFAWLKIQKDMVEAILDHNDNFINNETIGYIYSDNSWVDAKEFTRGRDNKKAFSDVIKKQGYNNISEYAKEKLTFDAVDMFHSYDADLANRFIRINNLYLKGDRVNIDSMLNTTVENGMPDLSIDHASEMSIFDTNSERRKGRYYLQGSSDKMIVNRAQDIMLGFIDQMEKILDKKETVSSSQSSAA